MAKRKSSISNRIPSIKTLVFLALLLALPLAVYVVNNVSTNTNSDAAALESEELYVINEQDVGIGGGCSKENLIAEIKDKYGARVKGDNIQCKSLISIKLAYEKAYSYNKYKDMMKNAKPYDILLYPQNSGCAASSFGNKEIRFYGLENCSERTAGYLALHVNGHLINRYNPAVYSNYPHEELVRKEPSCYEHGFLKSYLLKTANPKSESIAEANALFIYNSRLPISNFKDQCPNTFKAIKNRVFVK